MAHTREIIREREYVPQNNNNDGYGFLAGVIILILFVLLLVSYILPALKNSVSSSSPQINVPDKINVNINK